ncbi:MAG: PEP/pyruvate-binding domain-containing protein [bacterium]
MKYIKSLTEIDKNDVNIAGGKGASLGEMTKAGIPVPPGFVILSSTFDHFIEVTNLTKEINSIFESIKPELSNTIETASEKIEGLILQQEIPEDIKKEIFGNFNKLQAKFVAVRSSATAEDGSELAWAGQLESFLNTTEETLCENTKKCWASLFTPRAIFYRFENGLKKTEISVAVVVQKMIQSEKSGIAFSVHPVSENYNQLIIEAGFGLGEAIVSGSITPDSYVVEKEPFKIINVVVNKQNRALYRKESGGNEWKELEPSKGSLQILSEKEILDLSQIIIEIEKHYGFPCDIEWAFEKDKFYIVQSRPITTLGNKKEYTQDITDINIEKTIKEKSWVSRWAGSYTFLSCSFWGYQYTNSIKDILGKGFESVVFVHKKGVVTFYVPEKELFELGTFLAKKTIDNSEYALKMLTDLKESTDIITPLLKELSLDIPELDLFRKFNKLFERHLGLHVFMKKTVDYLPIEFLNPLLHNFVEVRKYSEHIYSDSEVCFRKIADNIAKKEGYDSKFLTCLTSKEFEMYLEKRILPDQEILSARYDSSLIYSSLEKPHETILTGKIIDDYESIILGGTKETKELIGIVAYPGKISGKCKIILNPNEVSEFNNGEILVTGMTRPEFLPYIQKASAIITDVGGMLCHAAVTARELKIPCIVGTNNATKILKNGDIVEFDTNKGIIKIIN